MTQKNGRLSSQQRREAILQAAATLFFEQGYAATSIDAIIERVGGSKRSIYSEFGNKEGLFSALVATCTEQMTAALTLPETEGMALKQELRLLGRRMLGFYLSPTMLGIYRTTLMEAHRFPEWSQTFYDMGPRQGIELFSQVLERARKRGELKEVDCAMAAGHFIGMLKGDRFYQVVLGLQPVLSELEIARQVDSIVDIFLAGVAAPDSQAESCI